MSALSKLKTMEGAPELLGDGADGGDGGGVGAGRTGGGSGGRTGPTESGGAVGGTGGVGGVGVAGSVLTSTRGGGGTAGFAERPEGAPAQEESENDARISHALSFARLIRLSAPGDRCVA